MKIGVRIPSLKKRIAARTSVKRMVRAKVRAPRGFGWLTNPKKAAYNRVYRRTTVGCLTLPIIILVIFFVAVLAASADRPAWTPVSVVYLPIISGGFPPPTPTATIIPTETPTMTATSTPLPTATATPRAMPGQNEQCSTYGSAQICASVSNATPSQNGTVTVYGRLLINGAGQQGLSMSSTWHYKSSTPTCSTGVTGSDGVASCSRSIGAATKDYQVTINVSIGGYSVNTWFTPQ